MSKYKSAGDLIKALEDGRLHEEAAFVGTLKRQVGSHAHRIGQLHEQVIGLTNENMQLRARHGLAERPGRTGGAAMSFDREFEVPVKPRQEGEAQEEGQPLECAECGGAVWYVEQRFVSAKLSADDGNCALEDVVKKHEPVDVDEISDMHLVCENGHGGERCGWEIAWDQDENRDFLIALTADKEAAR